MKQEVTLVFNKWKEVHVLIGEEAADWIDGADINIYKETNQFFLISNPHLTPHLSFHPTHHFTS